METFVDSVFPSDMVKAHAARVEAAYRADLASRMAASRRDDGLMPLIVPNEVSARGLLVIDPGVHGGYAFVGKDWEVYVQPFAPAGASGAYHFLKEKVVPGSVCIVESVKSSGGMSPKGAFTLGQNTGHWEMILTALDLRPFAVLPAVWQKSIPKVFGLTGKERKRRLLQFVKDNYFLGDYPMNLDTCDAFLMFVWAIQFWYNFATAGLNSHLPEPEESPFSPEGISDMPSEV
jgi:hypothetical protein